MKICVLASGSSGNSIFISSSSTRILVDAGLSGKEIERRLAIIDETLNSIDAICITHEHTDHTSGLSVLFNKYRIPIYANSATAEAIMLTTNSLNKILWQIFTTGSIFKIGDLTIEPFSLSHDAADPVGFVISDASCRVGIATDLGVPTTLVKERLKTCNVLILEFNHDEELLQNSTRPPELKQRIRGRRGHLSNDKAKDLLREICNPLLQYVFLAHISEECNTLSLALNAAYEPLKETLFHHKIKVLPTYADKPAEICLFCQ